LTLPFEDQEEITVPEPTKEKIAYERVKKKHPEVMRCQQISLKRRLS
jgi:hypothetical protein